jgi:4a-hydroxytetrahydrobiopterin dehydratase
MNTVANELASLNCKACESSTSRLAKQEIERLLNNLDGWTKLDNELVKTYHFKNYFETMAFVNATALVSHQENHHPDLEVSYQQCRVRYSTHAIGGLSDNDFICAAKIDCLQVRQST